MQEIKKGMAPVREATMLQVFLQALGYKLNPDGNFGPGTDAALRQFQHDHGLIVDGSAGEKTWTTLFALKPDLLNDIRSKWLSQADIDAFATQHHIDVPLVRTVYAVESGGVGFIGTQAKILFEGHVFWAELKARGIDPKAHVSGNTDILFPTWNPKSYVGGLAEYDRLARARAIHDEAALSAASWGLFQIMGGHAVKLGYDSVAAFVDAMQTKEAAHLEAFGRFITVGSYQGQSLMALLKAHQWAAFARAYNGPGYAKNAYDQKLAEAYAHLS